jgi:predicted MFS family arabinose efflux permease
MFVVPYYINISGRGTATKGGIMNTIFKAGSTSGWFVTGLFIRKIRKPWYALVAGAVLALVSSAWVMVRWTSKKSQY